MAESFATRGTEVTEKRSATTRTLGRDDWMTPPTLFDPVHEAMDFNLDACATNSDVARVDPFIDPRTDALRVPWSQYGSRVWVNPPYGRGINHWFAKVAKEAEHCESITLLTYANTDTRYWQEHVVRCPWARVVCFLKPRVKFQLPEGTEPPTGKRKVGAPKGSALIFYTQGTAPRHGPLHHSYWDYAEQPSFKLHASAAGGLG
jgi:phage N-6-adenine-methyltransferase